MSSQLLSKGRISSRSSHYLLRHSNRVLFFSNGHWTPDASLADWFETAEQAEVTKRYYSLSKVET